MSRSNLRGPLPQPQSTARAISRVARKSAPSGPRYGAAVSDADDEDDEGATFTIDDDPRRRPPSAAPTDGSTDHTSSTVVVGRKIPRTRSQSNADNEDDDGVRNRILLLDLPTEIFDMILQYLVARRRIVIDPASQNQNDTTTLKEFLAYRAVHSRFQIVLDPVIFRKVVCHIEGCNSRRLGVEDGVKKLLSRGRVASHVRDLTITTHFEQGSKEDGVFQAELCTVLQAVSTYITSLSFESSDHCVKPVVTFQPLAKLFPFPALRMVTIAQGELVTVLPALVQGAPALETIKLQGPSFPVTYEGDHSKIFKDMLLSPAGLSAALFPMRGVKELYIHEIESPWVLAFLTIFKPQAEVVTIHCESDWWADKAKEYAAATAHFASNPNFQLFQIQQDNEDAIVYLKEGLARSLEFFKTLVKVWQGRGIKMYTWELCREHATITPGLARNLDMGWDDLFRWVEVVS